MREAAFLGKRVAIKYKLTSFKERCRYIVKIGIFGWYGFEEF